MFNINEQPVRPPTPGTYSDDGFDEKLLTDFTGGMNITDLAETLPDNQFTNMSNLMLTRKGQLKTRPPYRPYAFSATVENTELSDGAYIPTRILDCKVIRATVSGWSYNGEIHVIVVLDSNSEYAIWAHKPPDAWEAGEYNSGDIVENNGYVYKANTTTSAEPTGAGGGTDWDAWNTWTQLWSSASASDVRIIPYQLNGAVDIFIYPDNDAPERYAFKADTLTDMGLTPPADLEFSITGITKANPAVITVTGDASVVSAGDKILVSGIAEDSDYNRIWTVASDTGTGPTVITTTESSASYASAGTTGIVHVDGIMEASAATAEGSGITQNGTYSYRFAYFYDDVNVTTKFGESPAAVTNHTVTITDITATNNTASVTIYPFVTPAPSGVTKVIVYRSPPNEPDGPFRFIGEITDLDSNWICAVATGEEGIEALPTGTNPSTSGSELTILKPSLVGTAIIGFDATITGKAIRSKEGNPDIWNPLAFDYLDGNGQGAVAFNRKIYIFTDKGCWQKDTADSPAFGISLVGCSDGRSIQDIGNGIVWLGHDSVYFADYIQQYGSKGDFPLDIGHEIFDDIKFQDLTEPVSSEFFERRYYLTFVQSDDLSRKTYVYDADFKSWQRHSVAHEAFAAGKDTLYSAGKEIYAATTYWYIYEHDYSADIASSSAWSTYTGIDRHDYKYLDIANLVHAGSKNITITLTREKVRLAGVFQRSFISSAIIYARADAIDADLIFTNEDGIPVTLNFTQSAGAGATYIGVYDDPGTVYAATAAYTVKAATDEFRGYTAINVVGMRKHKKVQRTVKDLSFDISLQVLASRDFRLSLLGFRYKPLQAPI